MEAIANVVMNRLGHKGFPNTICNVVRQGHEQGSCQFSWWCDGRSDQAKEDELRDRQGDRAKGAQPSTNGSNGGRAVFPSTEWDARLGRGIHQDGRDR